jgi:hypothetical protein
MITSQVRIKMISSYKDSDKDSDDIDSEENWLFVYNLLMKTRPNFTPKANCLMVQRAIKFICCDNCVTFFKICKSSQLVTQSSTFVYYQTKYWEGIALSLTDSKFTKSFVSTMKRYRKEYIKYNLIKYVVPHAVLHKQKRMPKEVISNVLSYL